MHRLRPRIEGLERLRFDDPVRDRTADTKISQHRQHDGEGDERAMIARAGVQRLLARSRGRARAAEQVADDDENDEAGKIDQAHRPALLLAIGVKNACGGQGGDRAGAAAESIAQFVSGSAVIGAMPRQRLAHVFRLRLRQGDEPLLGQVAVLADRLRRHVFGRELVEAGNQADVLLLDVDLQRRAPLYLPSTMLS